MPFDIEPLSIDGVVLVKPKVFADERGFFMELSKNTDLQRFGIDTNFVQDNLSYSHRGVVRGLHYQKRPKTQGKLVTCMVGSIFDVAVDIRVDSSTFGKWVSVELNSDNHHMLWIPEGFAHGFLVLSNEALVMYKVSGSEYAPECDAGIRWNDPTINIYWPVKSEDMVIMSDKDRKLPTLLERKEMGELL
jgi:dTDP-4-dehydrorhamnose 3,5-epimerase